jgi:hypothetical protein
MSRATRRAAASGPPTDAASLRAAIASARLKGSPVDAVERARRILLAWLDAALAQGKSFDAVVSEMAAGVPALTVARVELGQTAPDPRHACATGCAFCCILPGGDGGTITAAEARALHAALAPLAGQPDGRAWHPRACPSLDPATRACRAYAGRPVICRSYVSYDAAACEQIAEGTPAPGSGVLAPHVSYLLVHALSRAALAGRAKVPTYSMARIAAAAVAGEPLDTALPAARHRPRDLDDERKRSAAGYARAR